MVLIIESEQLTCGTDHLSTDVDFHVGFSIFAICIGVQLLLLVAAYVFFLINCIAHMWSEFNFTWYLKCLVNTPFVLPVVRTRGSYIGPILWICHQCLSSTTL